jgi:hypothetical protein
MMPKTISKNIDYGQVFLFIVWPVIALINAIRKRNQAWAKNIFWLFCAYYGFTFVIPENTTGDASRYINNFINMANNPMSLHTFFSYLYTKEEGFVDILGPLISIILSRFTSDGRILMAAYGLVFGFFYSRNLWYLFERINIKSSQVTLVFIIVFSLIDPIWKIGAFRFNTATHVFLYGILPFLIEGKKGRLWFSVLSILVHFSYFSPVLVLLTYLLTGNRRDLYFAIFIITFFIGELNIDFFRGLFSGMPGAIKYKADNYLSEGAREMYLEGPRLTHWYITYYNEILKYTATAFLVALYIKGKPIFKQNHAMNNLFCFILIYFSFANLASLLPMGIRFLGIANLLVFFILSWLPSLTKLPFIINRLRIFAIPFLLVIILVEIRKAFDFTSILTIAGNPILAFFIKSNIALIDIIK